MNINPQGFEIHNREVNNLLRTLQQSSLSLTDAELFFDFPMYKGDDDNLVISQMLLVSPQYGVIVFYSSAETEYNIDALKKDDKSLERVAGFVASRLIKNDRLRSGMMSFALPVGSLLYAPSIDSDSINTDNLRNNLITNTRELVSVVESFRKDFAESLFLKQYLQ